VRRRGTLCCQLCYLARMEHSEDKMLIEGDELGPVLHGLGCDPDIIGRDRRALTFELQDQARVAICRDPRDLFHPNCASLEGKI